MKHDRMWLRENYTAAVACSVSEFVTIQFYITDGINAIVLDEEAAQNLANFILTKLDD